MTIPFSFPITSMGKGRQRRVLNNRGNGIAAICSDGKRDYGIICDLVAVIDTDLPELTAWWEKNMPQTPCLRTPCHQRIAYPQIGVSHQPASVPDRSAISRLHRMWYTDPLILTQQLLHTITTLLIIAFRGRIVNNAVK